MELKKDYLWFCCAEFDPLFESVSVNSAMLNRWSGLFLQCVAQNKSQIFVQ